MLTTDVSIASALELVLTTDAFLQSNGYIVSIASALEEVLTSNGPWTGGNTNRFNSFCVGRGFNDIKR